jgi:hypothetical protein
MRIANAALAVALLGLAACATHETVTVSQPPPTPDHSATAAPLSAAPTPAATKTVIKYRDVTWQLLDSGMTTGQTYQQFVDGFSCTGSQVLSRNWESGDEVNFDLAATDNCTGAVQYFSGTDTVVNGQIVAADVSADN